MDYFAQQAINAIQLGSIYALIALGYSLVYGVLSMINFAHGDMFMVGAFVCLLLVSHVAMPFVVALLAVMAITALLGASIERVAYRPLRNAPRVSAIITALGCGLVIQNTTLSLSPYAKPMPRLFEARTFEFAGVTMNTLQLFIIAVSAALMIALDHVIRKTDWGVALRATAFDRAAVPLMGVPVNRVVTLTFIVGGALAGAAGVLYSQAYPLVNAGMGALIGWKAFVAAVIGGIGNVRGAVLGGYILGAVEVATVVALPSTWRDLIAYSLLLVILIFKPNGLLGGPAQQKV